MSEATQIAPTVKPDPLVAIDHGPNAHLFDTARFEQVKRVANAMAYASLLPKHLRGSNPHETQANCLRVVNQAIRWGVDPFAIMDETYVVSGKLGYQGKLVAAVINARAKLKGRLSYEFTGKKGTDEFTVIVSGTFEGEDQPRVVHLSVGQAKTANDIWKKDPEQKLCYSGATKWARRWCPEIIMGVLTDDDVQIIAETEPVRTVELRERLAARVNGNQPESHAAEVVTPEGEVLNTMADWQQPEPQRAESR